MSAEPATSPLGPALPQDRQSLTGSASAGLGGALGKAGSSRLSKGQKQGGSCDRDPHHGLKQVADTGRLKPTLESRSAMGLAVGAALAVGLCWASTGPLPAQTSTRAGETPAPPIAAAPQREAEEAAFREGLRQRGLDEWLETHLAETAPVSAVDEQLRRREALLAQATAPGTSRRQRQRLVADASEVLAKLIADHADHPARPTWRLELVRDRLEREDPAAFDAVLLYELPGRDRATVARLSAEAIVAIQALRDDVAAAWKVFESLDDDEIAQAATSGATRALEQLDGQSAFFLAWAQFYATIGADLSTADRDARLKELLEALTERYGWTAPVPGREVQRAGALAMATVALRLTGSFMEADRAARTIPEIVSTIKDPAARQGLDRAVLLAVLEQVRGPRDAGKLDDARAIVDEARKWAAKSRAGEIQTELALALVERSVLARQLAKRGPQSAPAGPTTTGLLTPAEALLPLQRVAAMSPGARDAVYEALAGAIEQEPLTAERSPFAAQLIAGAGIAEAVATAAATSTQPARNGHGLEIAAALDAVLAHPPTPIPIETRGELLFLQARAYYLGGVPLKAAQALCDLTEQCPAHDRAESAARQALAVAEEVWRQLQDAQRAHPPDYAREGLAPAVAPGELAAARAAFVRAGRALRKRAPNSPEARRIQFFIASALDEGGHFEEAAEEYAAVPADDPLALRAAWGRARCLRDALHAVTATQPAEAADAQGLAERAIAAARAAAEKAAATADSDPCLRAEITLVLAGVLNHPAIARYEEAVKVLEDFEKRQAACAPAIAPALRERVSALRPLKRLSEAKTAVEAYLKTDPENAGPLMARLLDTMRDEIDAAAERGDMAVATATADETAQLAEQLLAWAAAHPGRMGAGDTLTVSVWRARAMLEAGRPREALDLYEQAAKAPTSVLPADSALRLEMRLGKAECLLATNSAADGLAIFTQILSQVPEHSPNWWRAYVGTLACHTQLRHDPAQIVQSIRQQRRLAPDLGGPKWARELKRIEDQNAPATK